MTFPLDTDFAIAVNQAGKLGQKRCQPLDFSSLQLQFQLEVCVQVDGGTVDDVSGSISKLEGGAGLLKSQGCWRDSCYDGGVAVAPQGVLQQMCQL